MAMREGPAVPADFKQCNPLGAGVIRAGRLSDRALWTWLVMGALASLFVSYQVARQSVILGSRDGGWLYGYVEPFNARTLGVSLLATALCAGLGFSVKPTARSGWLAVAAWIGVFALDALIQTNLRCPFLRSDRSSLVSSRGSSSGCQISARFSCICLS